MLDVQLRPTTPADTDALASLLGDVFDDNPKSDPAVLSWQFWDNPAGQAVSWVAVADDGELVGHYAVLPIAARINGSRAVLAKPADAAIVPRAQRQGLMGRIAKEVFADCVSRGIHYTMALPNFRALGAQRKLGLEVVDRLRVLVRPLDPAFLTRRFSVPGPVARAATRVVFGKALPTDVSQVTTIPDGLDELVARNTPEGMTGLVHDAQWWQWRYLDAPFSYNFFEVREGGRLRGVATSRVRDAYGGRFLSLLDLVADDQDVARRLVGGAIAASGQVDGIATLALPGTRIHDQASRCGMRQLPTRLEPQPAILGVIRNNLDPDTPIPDNWAVSWCDLDHV